MMIEMKTNKPLFIGHGLNLIPDRMLPLAHALNRNPILCALDDHLHPEKLHYENGHWQRWSEQADEWVTQMDEDSDVLAYSLTSPLIVQALERAKKKINNLLLVSPAFYIRKREFAQSVARVLPDSMLVPSFNNSKFSCTGSLPVGLYRDMWQHAIAPKSISAKQVLVVIHRYDELLDAKATIKWAQQLNYQHELLIKPKLPLFHATFSPKRLPIERLDSFINSNS